MARDNSNRKATYRNLSGFEQERGHGHSGSASGGTSLRDSELIDLLRRAMAGDGYPVSGGREADAIQDNQAPLTSRIREILQDKPAPVAAPPKLRQYPIYEPPRFVEPEPELVPAPVQAALPVAPVMQPVRRAAEPPARVVAPAPVRWTPSLRATGFMVLMALAGGSIPALTASSPEYVAEAGLKLVGDPTAAPGLLEATASRLTSSHTLSQVVARLKLETNPEFNGGGATAYGVAKDLFTDNGGASDNLSRAQAALRERLTVIREPQTGIVRLSVRSEDAPQSVRIANLLAQIAVGDAALSPMAAGSSTSSDTSRKAYDDATAALDDFKAKAGEDKINAALKLQQQKQDLQHEIDRATASAQAATIHLAAAKTVKLSDVLTGSISPDLGSPAALEDLRNRYASAKSALTVLAAQLGPRHPRLLAQQSTVDMLSGNIVAEIQKLVGENDLAVKQANEQLKQLKNRAAAFDATVSGVDMAQLEKLQGDVEATRAAYENDLSTPAAPASAAQVAPLALLAPATAAPASSNGSVIVNESYGAMIGFGLALCIVACRMFMRNLWRNAGDLPPLAAGRPQQEPLRRPQPAAIPAEPVVDRAVAEAPAAAARPVPQPVAQPQAPLQRPIDRGVSEARQSVASLRARLETYAAQRPIRR